MPGREVKVTLVIDDKGSVKVVKQVGEESQRSEGKLKHFDKSIKELGKSFGGLKGMVGMGLGALGGVGLAGFGLQQVVSKTNEAMASTEKFSSITGIGAQKSLDYVSALQARGISAEQGSKSFAMMAKAIQTAERQERSYTRAQEKAGVSQAKSNLALQAAIEKGKPLTVAQAGLTASSKKLTTELGLNAEAYHKLGLNAQEFQHLNSEQKIETLVTAFSHLKGGTEKTALATRIFGHGAKELMPILQGGALGFQHQVEMAKKFMPQIKGGAKGMEEYMAKSAEAHMAMEGLELSLGTKLMPTLEKIMGGFSKLVLEFEKGKGVFKSLRALAGGLWGIFKIGIGIIKDVAGVFEHNAVAGTSLKIMLDVLSAGTIPVFEHFKEIKKVLSGIPGLFESVGNAIKGAFGDAVKFVGHIFQEVANTVIKGVNLVIKAINAVIKGYNFVQKHIPFGLGAAQVPELGEVGLLGRHPSPHAGGAASGDARQGTWGHPSAAARAAAHAAFVRHSQVQQHLKIELHLSNKVVAEQLMKDPFAVRHIAEGTTHYALKRQARR